MIEEPESHLHPLFRAYGLPVYVIFDNDDEHDKEGLKRQDICATLNIDSNTVMATKKLAVLNECAIFGIDYETTLRELLSEYEMVEKEVRRFMGYNPENKEEGKPLVVRETARRILENYDKWERDKKTRLEGLEQIKEKLLTLLKQEGNGGS